MQARPTRIGHIGIAVRDIDEAVRFYTEVIGLRLTERFDYGADVTGHGVAVSAGAFVRSDSTHHCISIFAYRDGVLSEAGGRTFGLHHIAFEMATHDELLAKYRELSEAGVPIVNARRGGPGNQPRFYAQDPDGNLLEFYWGIDQIGWNGEPREYGPIEEIDLEAFNFEAFSALRDELAAPAASAERSS